MNCLINRIGIAGCDAPKSDAIPASGEGVLPIVVAVPALPVLLINSLPGVTLAKIDSIADDDQDTYLDVWNDITLRALKKFDILAKAALNKCYRITDKTIIDCLVCSKVDLFDVALWYLHGTELMIEITSSDTLNRYTTIDIDKAEKLKEEFFTEFQAALDDAIQSINPEDSDCITGCVPCNDSIKFAWSQL